MKESEIKRAIEKIDWALLGVLDTVSRYEDILTMHLEKTSKETEDALQLVKDLCDFMIDDGSIDLSKVLQRIFDECMDINCGKHGDIKDGVLTEERQDIVDRILFNVSSISWEIQCYWKYIEEKRKTYMTPKNAPQSTINEGDGQQPTDNGHVEDSDFIEAKKTIIESYGKYIEKLDDFIIELRTMKPADFKRFYNKYIIGHFALKAFFEDCSKVVPWRNGEKGWNYENIKKQ